MKRLNLFVCAVLAIVSAASCDTEAPVAQDTTFRVSADYTSSAAYGHGSQGWIESDKLGVFVVSDGKAVASNLPYNPSQVCQLVENEWVPGMLTYGDPVGEVELVTTAPAFSLPHGFNTVYAYTPYVEGLTDMTAIPLPDASVQKYTPGVFVPDVNLTFAYNKAEVCDCGIVRMGQMTPAYTQMTIPSPSFPDSFVGKKVTKVVVAANSSYTKIAAKAATIDITTGKISGELVNAVEILLPEGGLDISSGYFGASTETLYVIMNIDKAYESILTTKFKFTYTIDGVDYEMVNTPSEGMSSVGNINMYGQLAVEEQTEEPTPVR